MKALLIDDDARILSSFQAELMAFDAHVGLVNVASARCARKVLAGDADFDFIVLDLELGADNGFELLAELAHAHPFVPMIAVSGSELSADAVRSIYLGAAAFVPRRAGGRALVAALRAVAAGELHVAPPAAAGADTARQLFGSLTPRQGDVLGLLMQGQSNKTMARALHLSVDTVKDHVTAVLRSLNVQSRTQAVLAVRGVARQRGAAGDGVASTFGNGRRDALSARPGMQGSAP